MLFAPTQCLEYRQDLPISLDDAWDFFSRPENLARITPPDLGFEVTSLVPARMYAGHGKIQVWVCFDGDGFAAEFK